MWWKYRMTNIQGKSAIAANRYSRQTLVVAFLTMVPQEPIVKDIAITMITVALKMPNTMLSCLRSSWRLPWKYSFITETK